LEAGALSYLLKPCNPEQLKAAVLDGLEKRALAGSVEQLQLAAAQAAAERARAQVRDAEARGEEAHAAAGRPIARVEHLQQIPTHLGRYLETEALLRQIVRAAAQLLESPMTGVYLVDQADGDLVLAAGEGLDVKRFGRIPRHNSVAAQAIARKT